MLCWALRACGSTYTLRRFPCLLPLTLEVENSLMDLMDSKKMEVTYRADIVWRYLTRQAGHAHLQHVSLHVLVGDGQRDRNLIQGGSFAITFTDAEFPSDSITNDGEPLPLASTQPRKFPVAMGSLLGLGTNVMEMNGDECGVDFGAKMDYSVKTGLELPHQEKEGEDSVAAELEDESIPTCLQTGSALEPQFTPVQTLSTKIPLQLFSGPIRSLMASFNNHTLHNILRSFSREGVSSHVSLKGPRPLVSHSSSKRMVLDSHLTSKVSHFRVLHLVELPHSKEMGLLALLPPFQGKEFSDFYDAAHSHDNGMFGVGWDSLANMFSCTFNLGNFVTEETGHYYSF